MVRKCASSIHFFISLKINLLRNIEIYGIVVANTLLRSNRSY